MKSDNSSAKTPFQIAAEIARSYFRCPEGFLVDISYLKGLQGIESSLMDSIKRFANKELKKSGVSEYIVKSDGANIYLAAFNGKDSKLLFGIAKADDGGRYFVTKSENGVTTFFNAFIAKIDEVKASGKSVPSVFENFRRLRFVKIEYVYQAYKPLEFNNAIEKSLKDYVAKKEPKIIPEALDPINGSHLDVMKKLLKVNRGLITGGLHSDLKTIYYFSSILSSLKYLGVTHLFIEMNASFRDGYDVVFNNSDVSPQYHDIEYLSEYRKNMGFMVIGSRDSFVKAVDQLSLAASKLGMKVVPVDSCHAQSLNTDLNFDQLKFDVAERAKKSDFIMAFNIEDNIKGVDGKFLFLCIGMGHSKVASYLGVPMIGIAEQEWLESIRCNVGLKQVSAVVKGVVDVPIGLDVVMLPPEKNKMLAVYKLCDPLGQRELTFCDDKIKQSDVLQKSVLDCVYFHLTGAQDTYLYNACTALAAIKEINPNNVVQGAEVFYKEFASILKQLGVDELGRSK